MRTPGAAATSRNQADRGVRIRASFRTGENVRVRCLLVVFAPVAGFTRNICGESVMFSSNTSACFRGIDTMPGWLKPYSDRLHLFSPVQYFPVGSAAYLSGKRPVSENPNPFAPQGTTTPCCGLTQRMSKALQNGDKGLILLTAFMILTCQENGPCRTSR